MADNNFLNLLLAVHSVLPQLPLPFGFGRLQMPVRITNEV
jgi:hypothetical protein